MDDNKLCLCDSADDHEICWDGIVSFFDSGCRCCLDTASQLEEFGE